MAEDEVLVDHIRQLRKIPGLEYARFPVTFECNLGYEAPRQAGTIVEAHRRALIPEVIILAEDGKLGHKHPGFRTSNESKKAMALLFQKQLHKGRVCFSEKFVYTSSRLNDPLTPSSARIEIVKELENYVRTIEFPNAGNRHTEPKEYFSGKHGKGTDDKAIATQLVSFMHKKFVSPQGEYAKYHR